MNISPEQQNALYELRLIQEQGDAIEILDVDPPSGEGSQFLSVDVSLSFEGILRSSDGIDLRQRERFRIVIPAGYPFEYPVVTVPHDRWAGFPHVQWIYVLCLYLSPETEWNPSDGMFGLIERLNEWVKAAALNQLDPVGAPLHPPVAYPSYTSTPLVVPQVDTPAVS